MTIYIIFNEHNKPLRAYHNRKDAEKYIWEIKESYSYSIKQVKLIPAKEYKHENN
jgi:hypothetical protein